MKATLRRCANHCRFQMHLKASIGLHALLQDDEFWQIEPHKNPLGGQTLCQKLRVYSMLLMHRLSLGDLAFFVHTKSNEG